MQQPRKILIADDETNFSETIATLLQKEGYECELVLDAQSAIRQLTSARYDLLIADIYMPGNENLELIRHGPLEGTPVLLVTGEPSLETAIESVRLPIAGYLVKPFRFDELKAAVSHGMELSQVYATLSRAKERLAHWSNEVESSDWLSKGHASGAQSASVDSFVEATVRNVSDALLDMARLAMGIHRDDVPESDVCRFFKCPRRERYLEAINETIEVLEKTKRSFRSKELGALRQKLERLER